ncbi:hypothetical protein [Pacificibacter marinus]|uniref:hypothetical protein n=1 Tax=Pacificibacter marinus TaxID=658057 RepID=UPI001C065AC9|nr:hypothetical protein [Pacificibacter marinus]MBU2867038.1 hypothetical protein [Pacificibacter marinus]
MAKLTKTDQRDADHASDRFDEWIRTPPSLRQERDLDSIQSTINTAIRSSVAAMGFKVGIPTFIASTTALHIAAELSFGHTDKTVSILAIVISACIAVAVARPIERAIKASLTKQYSQILTAEKNEYLKTEPSILY